MQKSNLTQLSKTPIFFPIVSNFGFPPMSDTVGLIISAIVAVGCGIYIARPWLNEGWDDAKIKALIAITEQEEGGGKHEWNQEEINKLIIESQNMMKKTVENVQDNLLNQAEAEELQYKIKDTPTTYLPHDWQFGFQTPNSPVMEGIIKFHDDLMVFLTFILFFVVYMIYACIEEFLDKSSKSRAGIKLPAYSTFIHHPKLEIIWTILPALILVNLALPSFSLLYSIDEIVEPTFTFKAVGHQWYWSYEIMSGNELAETVLGTDNSTGELNFEDTSFDSYMLAEEDLIRGKENHRRLLTVDNHLPLPVAQNVRVLVTSADVLHSWAVPSLGVKLDACPGRLNQTWLLIDRAGFYYGQCSELCGVNHGFMPIGILALDVLGLNIPGALAEALFLIATREES